jgi:cytochrome d ubiquinol oxidase subunit II
METIFFCLIAVMVTGYIVLDGFDLAAGLVQVLLARSDSERRALLASTGPACAGKEVWLLAGFGAISFALSGLTLPLAIVLWLLIVHGVSLQLRSHASSRYWPVWAGCFAGLGMVLALLCGASVGKVVRGTLAFDWYTCLVGAVALLALTMHGALWVAMKSSSPVRERAARLAHAIWWAAAAATIAAAAATIALQPGLVDQFVSATWGYAFPVIALAGLLGISVCKAPHAEAMAYISSCCFLAGILALVAFSAGSQPGLTFGVLSFPKGIVAWAPGLGVACAWTAFMFRNPSRRSVA